MVRGSLVGIGAVLAAASVASASNPFGFVLHMTPATYSGCATIDDATLTCEGIDVQGDSAAPQQFAWLIAYGWTTIPGWPTEPVVRGIGGAEFGIHYPAEVAVQGWTLCTGGSEIPQNDALGVWPASETGNAVTWTGGEYTQPSGFAKIGFFAVPQGSTGRMTVMGDPRIDRAEIAAADTQIFLVPPAAYSSADIDESTDEGRAACREDVPVQEASWGKIKSMF